MQLVDFAIRRRVTIAMATLAIALLGAISLSRLKVNLLPDLSYPTLTIRTELPGAAPLEVENLLTRPIEEAAGVIRNVRAVRSISRSGQSDVVLEFLWGTDMDFAGIDVRERLDLLQLPLEATRPLLLRFDPSTEPVMRLAFVDKSKASAAGTSEARLKFLRRFADDRAEAGNRVRRRLRGREGERRLRRRDSGVRGSAAPGPAGLEHPARHSAHRRGKREPLRRAPGTRHATFPRPHRQRVRIARRHGGLRHRHGERPACRISGTSRASSEATRTARPSLASTAANASSLPSTRKATRTPCSSRTPRMRASTH